MPHMHTDKKYKTSYMKDKNKIITSQLIVGLLLNN